MSIKNKEQISIHLKKYRNLSNYTIGRYSIRISIYTKVANKIYYAIPINVIQKNPSPSNNQNQPQTDQTYYTTKSFTLKTGSNADIDQICIFRFDVEIGLQQNDYSEIQSTLNIELIHNEYSKEKVVGQYIGKTKGIISDALIVDFYQSCPGQLIGSIHTCILGYQYIKSNKKSQSNTNHKISIAKQVRQQQMITQVLKYLQEVSQRNCKKTYENLSQLTNKVKSYQEKQKQKLFIQILDQKQLSLENDYKFNKENIISYQIAQCPTQANQDEIAQTHVQEKVKRKRKPIFQTVISHILPKQSISQNKPVSIKNSLKLPNLQKTLHQISMKIYQLWRQLNQILMKKEGQAFIQIKQKQYYLKLRNKIGQSVIRFKGLKDLDQYSDFQEIERRNMMVNQLRNQPKQILMMTNQFSVVNQKDFTMQRPIFFQENVQQTKKSKIFQKQKLQKAEHTIDFFLIFLVHGLGACRLDMEKLKIELKRYHQDKIKIYVSTSNESRTDGDIDAMGARLAGQVESQVAKAKGNFKISMVGHSMGGLIIRSALPRLQKISDKFYSLITFSSPHIGYAYSASKLVDAGLWIMNTMKKCVSIQQMTMIDSPQIEQCFLYKLSKQKGLEWFKKITFLASHQDHYVPFYSARIQKSKQIQTDFKKGFSRGISYCQMIDNILNRANGNITRLDVNFCIPEQNIDNLIGRAAHISFINNVEMLRTFCIAQEKSVF